MPAIMMHRRQFVEHLGHAAALAVAPWPVTSLRAGHWAWVHGERPDRTAAEWRRRFTQLREAGVTGVLVGGGDTRLLAATAHDSGLQFHRWIWTLARAGDDWAKTTHPEWFQVSRAGESSLTHPPYVDYYQWVCPTRPPVRTYLQELVAQIAQQPDVDGIQLDYIRFPDVILPSGLWSKYGLVQDREYAEFDFCYCEVCRSTFRDRTGVDPLDLPDPPSDAAWRAFRWNTVTELVALLAQTAHGLGKPLSAAVFPTPAIARRLVRQAWDDWPLDLVFPMVYHQFYEREIAWVGGATATGVATLAGRRPLYTGLYLPTLEPEQLGRAARLALNAGAAGVSLFESDGLTAAHLAVLRDI